MKPNHGTCERCGSASGWLHNGICSACEDKIMERARADAIARREERETKAQVIGLGLDVLDIDWLPETKRNRNAWASEWPIPLWLLTNDELDRLPVGTPVFSIMCDRKVVGVDEINRDERFGRLAWGLMDSQLPTNLAGVEG